MKIIWKHARRLAIGVIGFLLLGAGVVLLVTPLPVGWFLMPLGVFVLAGEYEFARQWLRWADRRLGAKRRFHETRRRLRRQLGWLLGPEVPKM